MEAHSLDLIKIIILLGAALVMVPLFRRIGLGSVLGYLSAGLIIGPFGLELFTDSESILHVAELGVVMFLFIIGMEMRPSHLWNLRKEIFGLGSMQILICTIMLTAFGMLFGQSMSVAFICGMGFVLTSTAIVMQVLSERGDISLPRGQKIVSILLFEDLLIVPLLAVVGLLAPHMAQQTNTVSFSSVIWSLGKGVAALTALIVAGLWLLNPLFRILARVKAREVMTAAALLVVLGSSYLMQVSGLSMALGAFLAGVLLSESSFRHQIEADIEPFRGILLGLFFMGVGMSLDLNIVASNWRNIIGVVLAMMMIKAACIYVVAKATGSSNADAVDRMTIMAQGGEFAFVLFTAAAAVKVIDATMHANFTAIVIISMAITPLVVILYQKFAKKPEQSLEGTEKADGLHGSVLVIGFGRFGQVMCQLLLARNTDVTIIDYDANRIRNAHNFGFKVYYGDGSRLDVLHAAGAQHAHVIAICIDKKESTSHIIKSVKEAFPQAKILVRAFDRVYAQQHIRDGADYQIRELFESSILFGEAALRAIGLDATEIASISEGIRRRDQERFELELLGQVEESKKHLHSNIPVPSPLVKPQRTSQDLTAEALSEQKS